MIKPSQRIRRSPSRKIKRLVMVGVVVGVLALVATAAVSMRAKQTSDRPLSNARTNLRYRAAAAVPLNSQTGQVRPLTQEEAQKLADGIKELVNQSSDGLQSVRHADGSVSIDLQGRFQNIAVAKIDEDGKLSQSCIDNRAAAAAFFEIDPQLVGVKSVRPSTNNTAPLKGGDR